MEDLTPNQSGIRVGIVYNTFKPHEVDWHTLPYEEGATVKDYIGDLAEGTWQVGYMGEAYGPDQWGDLTLKDGDAFSFVQVPESGGGGGKDILRMVAMIAVMVVAFYVVGPWAAGFGSNATVGLGAMTTANLASGIAMGSFAAAGMLAVNALIPPATPSTKEEGRNYGIDGPKNTAKEGPVVPRGYGKYWFAGNIVDSYTKLHGDTQYLYVRTIINDGPIQSVSDFRINGEPIANYDGVETRVSLGTNDGDANDWFGEAVRMQSISAELDTEWTARTTNTEVDRVRVDLTYPEGLGYWKDDGKVVARLSQIQFRYRKVGDTVWKPLHSAYEFPFVGVYGAMAGSSGYGVKPKPADKAMLEALFGTHIGGALALRYGDTFSDGSEAVFNRGIETYGNLTTTKALSPLTGKMEDVAIATVPAGTARVTAQIRAGVDAYADAAIGAYQTAFFYREKGTSVWLQSGEKHVGTVERNRSGSTWANFPLVYRNASAVLNPTKQYEIAAFGGIVTTASATITGGTSGQIEFNKSAQESFRYSFESGALERGKYEIGVRRVIGKDDNPKSRDSVFWTDLAEIDLENIHYVGTANVSLKIKVDDQINSIPNFTCLVEASKVNTFDIDGNVVENKWSPYPCWQAIDVLTNQETGRGLPTSRIDFPSVLEWEEHCIRHGLEFNAVFDQKTNVWDVLQKLCRVGHAQIVRQGTKYTFVVDKKAEPVQIFNDANILEGTFSTTWLGISERANEVRYTYYPTEKEGKEEMLRVADPFAVKNGIEPRVLEISEQGVTKREQAMFNVEKQLRENRYIRKSVSFDAPMESISLTIGEVALIQHSSAHYGKGIGTGLLKHGSTASRLMLDCPITLDANKDYRVLTVHDALKRYTVKIESISHNTVYVSGLPSGALNRCVRLKQGSVDVGVENIHDGNPFDRVICSSTKGLKVGTAELWDTEVIEERSVKFAAGEIEEIELVTPLSAAPSAYAKWMVGPVETIKAPYRLRGISGDDLYRRSLTFIEYNDLVYEPLNADYQPSQPIPSTVTGHVKLPSISWPLIVEGQTTRVTVKLSWERGDVNYAGADLYVSRNGAPFEFLRSVQDVTAVEMDANLNDDIQVRIVAFGRNSIRQAAATAPVVGGLIQSTPEEIAAPRITSITTPTFKVDGTIRVEWTLDEETTAKAVRVEYGAISAGENASGVPSSATAWTLAALTDKTFAEIPNISVGYYAIRVRGENGRAFSPWSVKTYEVEKPELPQRVTGLRLDHTVTGAVEDQFVGQNAKFVWNDVAASATSLGSGDADAAGMDFYWRDYVVRVKALDGALIREEITRNAFYEYTLEKNKEDSRGSGVTARRAFRVEVAMRGRQGQESSAVGMNVSNPAPLPPEVMYRIESVDSLTFAFRPHSEPDVEGVIIWAKETSGFTPTFGTEDYRGPDPFPTVRLQPKKTYFIRFAAYDALGFDNLRFSEEIQLGTTGLTNDYFDESFYDGVIPADVMNKIMLIDGDGPGSVNERLSGVRSEIEDATDSLNRRIDTATSTGGNRVFYQNSEPTASTGNDLWINPDDSNRFKRWNGLTWEYVDDVRINSLTSYVDEVKQALTTDIGAVASQTNEVRAQALQRNRTFRQASAPTNTTETPLSVGDLWYDTSNGNKPYRWAGVTVGWQETSDQRFDTLAASIQTEREARVAGDSSSAQEINRVSSVANAKNRVYRQSAAPADPVTGDVWIDTTDVTLPDGTAAAGNVLKRWNGSTWELTNDPRIATSAAMVETLNKAVTDPSGSVAQSISKVSAQAQGKNRTFFQNAAPTSTAGYTLAVGDLWMKSNDNNRMHRWSGTAWVATEDGRIASLDSALTDERTARANADSALSERITTASATAGAAKALAESHTGAIATLDGKSRAWAKQTVVSGTTSATIEMSAETADGKSISLVTMLADEIGLGKTGDGTNRPVLRIRNGATEIVGSLSATSGIFLGGSGGATWPVALRTKDFAITDGVALDFGLNLGTIPSYEISPIGLAPLNAGESYDLRLNNLTGSGCTPYLKINVPAQSVVVDLRTDAAGGSGAPTRVTARGSNPEAVNGEYTFQIGGNMSWTWRVIGPSMGEYVERFFEGSALIGVWKKSGGVWTKVADWPISAYGNYYGAEYTGENYHSESFVNTATFQMGSGATDFGITIGSVTGGNKATISGLDLMMVRWQAQGTGANIRSATPSGFQGKVTIRPQ